jgi:hypothetical protein
MCYFERYTSHRMGSVIILSDARVLLKYFYFFTIISVTNKYNANKLTGCFDTYQNRGRKLNISTSGYRRRTSLYEYMRTMDCIGVHTFGMETGTLWTEGTISIPVFRSWKICSKTCE